MPVLTIVRLAGPLQAPSSLPYSRGPVALRRFPTSMLDYALDPERIAREPVQPRDAARMMVVHRESDRVEHRFVRDLPAYLQRGDLMVVNRTHVMAARIKLRRRSDGRLFEGLLDAPLGERRWRASIRQARRLHAGDRLDLIAPGPVSNEAIVAVLGRAGEGVEIAFEGSEALHRIIDAFGWTPLPPYIRKSRADHAVVDDGAIDQLDRSRYQTVYALPGQRESIAAPTAGLHFTPDLLEQIQQLGVARAEVRLQVGAGTFKPVETEFLEDHPMHAEFVEIPGETLAMLRAFEERRSRGAGRVLAIGTTTVRAIESLPDPLPDPSGDGSWSGETSLLILPDSPIRRVDALLTNFHLPHSTLLALVGAFVGMERLRRLYDLAQGEGYRFFSFGDAMLVI